MASNEPTDLSKPGKSCLKEAEERLRVAEIRLSKLERNLPVTDLRIQERNNQYLLEDESPAPARSVFRAVWSYAIPRDVTYGKNTP
jgi:hypothetical protein